MISIERDVGRGERFREPVDMSETNGIRLFNKQHRYLSFVELDTAQTENSPQHWISKWRQWIGGEECSQ